MILKGTSHIHPTFWLLSGSFLYNKWSISTFEEKCQVEFFEGKGVCIYVKELAAKSAVLVMSQSLAGSQSFRSRILVGMPELPALHVSQDSAGWQNIPSSHWCRRQLSEQSQPSQELSILDNLFLSEDSFSSLPKQGVDVSKISERKLVYWTCSVNLMLALVIQKLIRPSLCPPDAHDPVKGDKQMNYYHVFGGYK